MRTRPLMQTIATPSIHDRPPAILVVDDELQIRALLSRWLTTRGSRVVSAESAATALRYLESEPVDLVTVDILMPEEAGDRNQSSSPALEMTERELALRSRIPEARMPHHSCDGRDMSTRPPFFGKGGIAVS
jgi:CheY-like chemotaxis protein